MKSHSKISCRFVLITAMALILMGEIVAGHIPARAETVVLDADRQYQYAEQLTREGRFLQAASEYLRFAFFFPEDPRARLAELDAGRCFAQANDPSSAIDRFQALTRVAELDDVAREAYFLLAEAHHQAGETGLALIDLRNLMTLSRSTDLTDRILYRMSWLYIDQLDWPAARRYLEQMSAQGQSTYQVAELLETLAESDNLKLKNPTLAGSLSVIPGLGQLYCGRYEDALAAFGVNLGLFWGAFEAFDHDLNVLGSLMAIVGSGFYVANIYSAVSSAHKYNMARKQGFGHQLKDKLSLSLGPTPHTDGLNLMLALKMNF